MVNLTCTQFKPIIIPAAHSELSHEKLGWMGFCMGSPDLHTGHWGDLPNAWDMHLKLRKELIVINDHRSKLVWLVKAENQALHPLSHMHSGSSVTRPPLPPPSPMTQVRQQAFN